MPVRKAKDVGGSIPHTMILGANASGKSTHAVDLLNGLKNVLWVTTGSTAVLANNPEWDVLELVSFDEFSTAAVSQARKYEAVVIDSLDMLRNMALPEKKDMRQAYLEMGNNLAASFRGMKRDSRLIVVCNTVVDESRDIEGKLINTKEVIALNNHLLGTIPGMFDSIHYCKAGFKKEKGRAVGTSYLVETNKYAALNLTILKKGDN